MKKKTLAAILFALACCLAFAGCGADTHTVTYELNYGGAAPFAKIVADGGTAELPEPERDDYAFSGWFTDAACTADYTPAPVTSDMTLYAAWTHTGGKVARSLRFSVGEGAGEVEDVSAFSGDEVTLPAGEQVEREHFIFSGWSDGQTVYAGGSSYTVTESVTFSAVWKRAYTVSFLLGEGTGEAPADVVAAADSTVSLPDASGAPSGYAFYGWQDETGTSYEKGASMTVTGNTVLRALWAGDYTVSFDEGAGTGAPSDIAATTGEEVTLPAYHGTAARGYEFTGWSDGETLYAAGDVFTVGAGNARLTAQFRFVGHYVSFVDWDGFVLTKQLALTGESVSAPDMSAITEFTGWDKAFTNVTEDMTVNARYSKTFTYKNYFTFTLNRAGTGYTAGKSATGSLMQKNIVIPATFNGLPVLGVTSEGFSRATIESVYLPSTVTTIGSYAFYYCGQLKEVVYADGCRIETIGQSAFRNAGLTEIFIPASVQTISSDAFYGSEAASLTFAGNSSLTTIGNSAFQNCTAITSVVLPDGLTAMGMNAFYQCISLESVYIPALVTVIPDFCFSMCFHLETVTFAPDSRLDKVGAGDKPTGGSCFFGTNLGSITLPASVTFIDRKAFANCKQLTEVQFAGACKVERIREQAFETCRSLSKFNSDTAGHYNFPATLKAIETLAFCENASLRSVTFQEGLLSVGAYAFSAWNDAYYDSEYDEDVTIMGEKHLKNVYPNGLETVALPASIEELGDRAFFRNNSLMAIRVAEGNTVYRSVNGVLYTAGGLKLLIVPTGFSGALTVETGCEEISDYAAYKNTALTGLTIPASVRLMGEFAFAGSLELASVTFAGVPTLTEIPDYGFTECVKLTAFTLPASATRIGEGAFYNCMGLLSFTIADDSRLEEIASFAFGATVGSELPLTSFVLPDSVKSIGVQAFANTTSMSVFTINPTSKLESIGYMAFSASGITSFYFPSSLQTLYSNLNEQGSKSSYAFERCKNLTSVTFAENGKLTEIGNGAFHSAGLTSIRLPETITTIGEYAFTSTKLTNLALPETVTVLGRYAFYNCTLLEEATIDAKVTEFGIHTFGECVALQSVTLPDTLRSIGNYCFNACKALKAVTLRSSIPPTLGMSAFGTGASAAPLETILVPQGSGALYKSRWSGYASLIQEAA